MTPPPLSSELQLPFEKGYITKLESGVRRNLTNFEEEDVGNGETEDPGLHPEWSERRDEIDPGWKERILSE